MFSEFQVRQLQSKVLREEWEWLRLSRPDPDRATSLMRELIDKEEAVMKQCSNLLVRRRQGRDRNMEIVSRPGLPNPDAVAAVAGATTVANRRAGPSICIAAEDGIFRCNVDGVTNEHPAYHTCGSCSAQCY